KPADTAGLTKSRGLVEDLPAAVRLLAGGAVGALGLAADGHRLLVFAAGVPAAVAAFTHRRDAALVTALRVGPHNLLAYRRIGGAGCRTFIVTTVLRGHALGHLVTYPRTGQGAHHGRHGLA